MSRKRIAVLVAALIVIAGAAAFVWWWMARPPEAARLLPDPDAVVYLNLRPLRLASAFGKLPQVRHDPDYDEFVRSTGFDFERDLDEAAIAVHLPPEASNPLASSQPQQERRYSEAFIGRFDVGALSEYFDKLAPTKERYAGTIIYTVPVESRTVRLAVLNPRLAVVSNVEDASVIRGMIDRSRARGLVTNGPELVGEFYKEVPAGSLAWVIARPKHNLPLPNGLELAMPDGVTWVGSARYTGDVQLKAQAITPNEADAKKVAEGLTMLLALFHSVQQSVKPQGVDADVTQVFESVQVSQQGSRAVVTANVPAGFLQKMARQ